MKPFINEFGVFAGVFVIIIMLSLGALIITERFASDAGDKKEAAADSEENAAAVIVPVAGD